MIYKASTQVSRFGFYTLDIKKHIKQVRKARKQAIERKRREILHALSKV